MFSISCPNEILGPHVVAHLIAHIYLEYSILSRQPPLVHVFLADGFLKSVGINTQKLKLKASSSALSLKGLAQSIWVALYEIVNFSFVVSWVFLVLTGSRLSTCVRWVMYTA